MGRQSLPDWKASADLMNAMPQIRELDRIIRDIGVQLRVEPEVSEPLPQKLKALLKELEILVHHAERQRLFAEIEIRVAELIDAAGPATECTRRN
jgi:hypothetical protein